MAASESAGPRPDAPTGRAPPPRKGRRRPTVRWIVHGVMFVALAAGVFVLLPRLGGLSCDAAGLRHARPAFVAEAIVAHAVSLGSHGSPNNSPTPPAPSTRCASRTLAAVSA